MPATPRPCPACKGPKHPAQYLCRGCWFTLPATARTRLKRRDAHAGQRLIELHRQLTASAPLHTIQITTR